MPQTYHTSSKIWNSSFHYLLVCLKYCCMCHRGEKSTWPDRDSNPGPLANRASTLANGATEPHGRPATISPCLNRFVPESARNRAGTDETVPLLLVARAWTHTEPPNVTGEKKAHGPTGTRTQDLSQTVRYLGLLWFTWWNWLSIPDMYFLCRTVHFSP